MDRELANIIVSLFIHQLFDIEFNLIYPFLLY